MNPSRLLPFLLASFDGPCGHFAIDTELPEPESRWVAAGDVDAFERLMRSNLAFEHDLTLTAMPYAQSGSRLSFAQGSALWVRTETGAAVEKLSKAKNRPTLVLQEGATFKRVAFWAVEESLTSAQVLRFNRKLSHLFGTPAAPCEPSFRFYPPGAVIRAGRKRPVSVQVAEQTDAIYPVSFVEHLPDRPEADPSKWRK